MTELTVLIIEDNEMNRDILQRRLEKRGIKTLIAVDGLSGVSSAENNIPNAIILDINLPDIDGFEVSRRLKNNPKTQKIPIIGLSAHSLDSDREQAFLMGFSEYETKPVNLIQLIEKIKSLTGK